MIHRIIIVMLTLASILTAGAWVDSYAGPPFGPARVGRRTLLHHMTASATSPSTFAYATSEKGWIRLGVVEGWGSGCKDDAECRGWFYSYCLQPDPRMGSLSCWLGLICTLNSKPTAVSQIGLTGVSFPHWLAAGLFAIYPTIAFIRGPLRRYRRRKPGLCVTCGYDLTGNVSGVCPECGVKVEQRDPASGPYRG